MDHSHHGDMDMGDGGAMCNMNMLFTWDTSNLCIVFRSWRITGLWSLFWSLIAVMALTAGYEVIREMSRRYEMRLATTIENATLSGNEQSSLLRPGQSALVHEQRGKLVKAVLYGVQVFYSFFIMLLFMTYNGWIMLAVGVGATIGHLMFSNSTATKSAACH